MTTDPSSPPPTWVRPAVHATTGFLALLLAVLPRPYAVFAACLGVVAGWVVIPFTVETWLRRPGERFLCGLRTYPLAVLGLVLLLPPAEAAAGWGVLAFGDPAAAVAGQRIPSPRLFGHKKATIAGSLAYLVVGAVAAFALSEAVAWAGPRVGLVATGAAPGAVRALLAAVAAVLADLVPVPPDDNLPAAAAAGLALAVTRA